MPLNRHILDSIFCSRASSLLPLDPAANVLATLLKGASRRNTLRLSLLFFIVGLQQSSHTQHGSRGLLCYAIAAGNLFLFSA